MEPPAVLLEGERRDLRGEHFAKEWDEVSGQPPPVVLGRARRIAGFRSRSTSQSVASSANVGSRSGEVPVAASPGCHRPSSIFASCCCRGSLGACLVPPLGGVAEGDGLIPTADVRSRSSRIGLGGTKLGRTSPCCTSWIHSESLTSV